MKVGSYVRLKKPYSYGEYSWVQCLSYRNIYVITRILRASHDGSMADGANIKDFDQSNNQVNNMNSPYGLWVPLSYFIEEDIC